MHSMKEAEFWLLLKLTVVSLLRPMKFIGKLLITLIHKLFIFIISLGFLNNRRVNLNNT